MRKALLLSVVAAMLLFACRKEHTASINPALKKYKIAINVSNFSQFRANFALRQHAFAVKPRHLADSIVSVGSYLDVLYYLVFDGNGNYLKTISQDSTMCDQFGLITDSLASGNYFIAMAAGKSGMTSVAGINRIDSYYTYDKGFAWQDAFYAGFDLTVTNTPVSQTVTLHRSISKFELHVEDSIPQSANTIGLSLTPEFWNLSYNHGTLPVSTQNVGKDSVVYTIPASAKGHTGYTLDRLVSDTYGYYPTYAVITCWDASNKIIAQKIIGGLIFMVNEKTILSGKLFQGTSTTGGQQSFTVKVDTAWGSTNHISF
ncbi:MAG TPA: FimB/Mfa2 family fimbrial subunit [Mucilaginibacter sp.]|jgi:hypothetical protein|nr:FimB/Mfa2 family fimbrial subunit [Mucilaginibacter sp.]